ncbi:MAG: HEAT repeat domain-containing protein [Planctomycetaceae bacterium]
MSELLVSEKDGQVRLAVFDTVTDMGPAAADAVPALVHTLSTDYGGKKNEELHQDYRAALALAAIGEPAVNGLRELLTSEADNVRAEAAMALGRIGPPAAAAVADLIRALADSEDRVRQEASQALGKIGDAAVAELTAVSTHADSAVRAAAMTSIGITATSDKHAIDAVLKAADDSEPVVRSAAITAAGQLKLPDDVRKPLFLENLRHPAETVRLAVVNILVDDRSLLDELRPELTELLADDDDGVTWHAAFLIQRLGPESASTLIEALRRKECRIDQIGRALAMIGRPTVDPLLASFNDADPRVKQGAALALGQVLPLAPETVQTLAAGLSDSDRDVQAACLTAIGYLGPRAREAVPAVREKLRDESPLIREQAIGILFESAVRDASLMDDLSGMLDDDDPRVQRRAIDAIRSAGPLGRRALPAVVEKLRSADGSVRIAAAEMIGSHGRAAEEAVPALTSLLDSQDPQLRIVVTQTLSELGPAARPAFEKLTKLIDDKDVEVRAAVIRTIGNLDLEPAQVRSYLAAALHDSESDVRRQASRGIQRFGRRGNIFLPDIILLAADSEQSRFLNRALERYETYDVEPQTVTELRQQLDHEHDAVRLLAIRFLGIAGSVAEAAVPQLETLAHDDNEEIRMEVTTALAKIHSR